MFTGWLFLLGLFLGFAAASISVMQAPDLLAHIQKIIELGDDYEEARNKLRSKRNKISDDFGLRCSTCLEGITQEEAQRSIKKISELAEK